MQPIFDAFESRSCNNTPVCGAMSLCIPIVDVSRNFILKEFY